MAVESLGGLDLLQTAFKKSRPIVDGDTLAHTLAEAEDAASDWIWLPPGRYYSDETKAGVKLQTNGVTVGGAGYQTIVDGRASKGFSVSADDITIQNLRIVTNDSDGGGGISRESGTRRTTVRYCWFNTGGPGCKPAAHSMVYGNVVEDSGTAVSFGPALIPGGHSVCVGNHVLNTQHNGVYVSANDVVTAFNIIENAGKNGIAYSDGGDGADDGIIYGNRIHNSSADGIFVGGGGGSANNLIANNRISGSGGVNIDNSGTNTTTDANVTGAAN